MSESEPIIHPGLAAIQTAFSRETDRAAAIVAAAMLDDGLATLLGAFLVEPRKAGESIVDGEQAPLGTFSARINAAHQMGLISPYFARDLHLIRKIRNHFAHSADHLTFETPEVRDRVAELEKPGFNRRFAQIRAGLGPPGPRGDFLGIVSWMIFSHQESAPKTKRQSPHVGEFGYFDVDSAIEIMTGTEPDPFGPSIA